jgi:hypothetical protein
LLRKGMGAPLVSSSNKNREIGWANPPKRKINLGQHQMH